MISYDVTEFGQPLEQFERPTPTPAGTEVLLRTLAAGVCHSDLHLWEGGYDLGAAGKLNVEDRGIKRPFTMGHEVAGEVVALGPAVDNAVASGAREAAIGRRYLVYPWIGCGHCAVCASGEEQLCMQPRSIGIFRPGGYGDHVMVPHPRYLIPLGGLTPAEAAPYACSGVTTYGALRKLGPLIESQPIVLLGAGGLGLMCLTVLKAMGGRGAVVVDIDERKRQAALQAGALAAVDGNAPDAASQIAAAVGGPVLGVIDYVGGTATVQLALGLLAKGGKLVIVGLFGGDVTLSLPPIPMRALTIQGSYVGSLQELQELIALVARSRAARIPITPRPFAEASQALSDLHAGRAIGRYVLVP
ncbi:MAG: alcohol dehydrogenase catalytic domain-containing protein [Alphaproteobacteria bacterium]|nr:alcohol dehydrogenase catalytic domain-containing protein [Alphaproteobacteria bacterium]